MGYVTLDQFQEHADDNAAGNELQQQLCIDAASAFIDKHCNRTFTQETNASARYYRTNAQQFVITHDFWTTSGLEVATDGALDGTFSTAITEFQLEPFESATPVAPYWKISAVRGSVFPCSWDDSYTVKVTAKWGWPAVPEPIEQACLMLSVNYWKQRENTSGTSTLPENFYIPSINRNVRDLINPYIRRNVI